MVDRYGKVKGLAVAATLFLSWPTLGSAEMFSGFRDGGLAVGDKGFYIGPRAAYFKPKDAEKGKWSVGAQVGLPLSSALGLEGSIDYRTNRFADDVTIKVYPVQASLRATLIPRSPVSPFLVGGAGWYFTQLEGPRIEKRTDNRFGLHAGGGLEVMLGGSLSIDGSYRYIWLEKTSSRDLNALEKDYRDSGSMITAALNFLF